MKYEDYIKSAAWKVKRQQRLEIDGNQCVVCKSSDRLSVHHLTYERLGDEDVLHDLVTACGRCHPLFDDVERHKRYSRRKYSIEIVASNRRERRDMTHGMEDGEIQSSVGRTNVDARREHRRPVEFMDKKAESYFQQTREDRFRSPGNGKT